MMDTTAQRVLNALQQRSHADVKQQRDGTYRFNNPLRPGSNSHAGKLTLAADGEHGVFYDHVSKETYTLYQFAQQLGVELPQRETPATEPLETFESLAAYAARQGVPEEVFAHAGWKLTRHKGRPALVYPVDDTFNRYRYLDGHKPKYMSEAGYTSDVAQWYRLDIAVNLALATNQPLVICNGEASTLVAQYYGVAATCVPGGEKHLPDHLVTQLRKLYSGAIRVVFDSDKTGREVAPHVVEQLQSVEYTDVAALDLQGGKGFDLANFCKLHGESSVADLQKCKVLGESGIKEIYHISELHLLPPVRWLVDDEIIEQGLSVLCAPSQSGKSFVCVDRACRLALAGKTVFYIAAEGASGYKQRTRAWAMHHNVDTDKLPIYFYPKPAYLMQRTEAEEIIAKIRHIKPDLIIIDTLLRCIAGGDINSNADVSVFIDNCGLMQRELGSAVQIVHHTNKSGKDLGAIALFNASDVFLTLENQDGYLVLQQTKNKDGEHADLKSYRTIKVTTDIVDEHGKPVTSLVIEPSEKVLQTRMDKLTPKQFAILEFLDLEVFEEAGCPSSKIESAVGIAGSTLYNTLSTLKRLGYVSQGKRGDPFSITRDGQAAVENYRSHMATTKELPKSSSVVVRSRDEGYRELPNHDSAVESTTPTTKQLPNNYQGSNSTTTPTTLSPLGESSGVGRVESSKVVEKNNLRAKVQQAEKALDEAIARATPEVQRKYEAFEEQIVQTQPNTPENERLCRAVEHYITQGGQFGELLQLHKAWSLVVDELERL